eukprot:scaffold1298_cov382-Prasinococcus_capsulatus_cf.AAC.6
MSSACEKTASLKRRATGSWIPSVVLTWLCHRTGALVQRNWSFYSTSCASLGEFRHDTLHSARAPVAQAVSARATRWPRRSPGKCYAQNQVPASRCALSCCLHQVWNHNYILDNIRDSPVTLVLNGHYHPGYLMDTVLYPGLLRLGAQNGSDLSGVCGCRGYSHTHGIHHVVVEATVEAPHSVDAHAVVTVSQDCIEIVGHGAVTTRHLPLAVDRIDADTRTSRGTLTA